MKLALRWLAAALLVIGCGGKGKEGSTTETPQGAAKLWLQAALNKQDDRLRELSTDALKEQAAGYAASIRERFNPDDQFRWGASGQEGEDYAWSAVGSAGVVFMKVRKVGEAYRVQEISTSW